MKDQLDLKADALVASGVPLQEWGIDPETNSIAVEFSTRTAENSTSARSVSTPTFSDAIAAVSLAIPDLNSTFSEGEPIVSDSVNRLADFGPHWGGAWIRGVGNPNNSTRYCTSGSAWAPIAGPFFTSWKMMTAAHCGDTTVSWTSGNSPLIFGPTVWTGGSIAGVNRIDVAMIEPYYGAEGVIYIGAGGALGGPTSTVGDRVAFYYSGVQTGVADLRISGAYSGVGYSPGVVLKQDISVNYGSSTYYHQNSRSGCVSQSGDSGAPTYTYSQSGQLIFAGVHSGHGGTTCYYTPVSAIIAAYGGTPGG